MAKNCKMVNGNRIFWVSVCAQVCLITMAAVFFSAGGLVLVDVIPMYKEILFCVAGFYCVAFHLAVVTGKPNDLFFFARREIRCLPLFLRWRCFSSANVFTLLVLGITTVAGAWFQWSRFVKRPSFDYSRITYVFVYELTFKAGIIFLLVGVTLFHSIWVSDVLRSGSTSKKCVSAFLVVLYISFVAYIVGIVMGTLTIPAMQRGILIDSVDPCAAARMSFRKKEFSEAYVLPLMIPPRFYTYLFDNERCHSSSWHKLGYVDMQENTLLVTPKCRSGQAPRILVYIRLVDLSDPWKAFYADSGKKVLNFTRDHNLQDTVIIRWFLNHKVKDVELKPELLVRETRTPQSDEEKTVRDHWIDRSDVIKVPLGSWAQYIVDCGRDGQQIFVHPLSKRDQWEKADVACNEEESPNGNVLVFMMDALSRPASARRLVKFQRWLNKFRHENKTGHLVEEHPLTSFGSFTLHNLPMIMSGNTKSALTRRLEEENVETVVENDLIHSKVKKKYGDSVYTTFNVQMCDNYLDLFGANESFLRGLGQGLGGVDQIIYDSFCFTSAQLQNVGSRCYFNEKTHEIFFDYVDRLVHVTLHRSLTGNTTCPSSGSSFFHFFVLTESHEPTERNLQLSDGDFVSLMEKLELQGFFNNPRNSIVLLGDHGMHFGVYRAESYAGAFENYNPLLLYIVHPETMNRIDAYKNRTFGTSVDNFVERKNYLSTHLDVYLTFCDIMGVQCDTRVFDKTEFPSTSAFDKVVGRDRPMKCSSLFGEEDWECTLSFCEVP